METNSEPNTFISIDIEISVARKFIEYSRNISRSPSSALLHLLECLERTNQSQVYTTDQRFDTLEALIEKRSIILMSILKNMQRTQTKPTLAILEALLEVAEPQKKPLIVENNTFRADRPETDIP